MKTPPSMLRKRLQCFKNIMRKLPLLSVRLKKLFKKKSNSYYPPSNSCILKNCWTTGLLHETWVKLASFPCDIIYISSGWGPLETPHLEGRRPIVAPGPPRSPRPQQSCPSRRNRPSSWANKKQDIYPTCPPQNLQRWARRFKVTFLGWLGDLFKG